MATKEADVLLTTKDNKFNPFTEYEDWKNFDETTKHYYTEAYVARIVALLALQVRNLLEGDISEKELAELKSQAYDEIIELNDELGYDIYVKVSRDGKRINDSPSQYLESIKQSA